MGSAVVTSAEKIGPGEKLDLKTCWMMIYILEIKARENY